MKPFLLLLAAALAACTADERGSAPRGLVQVEIAAGGLARAFTRTDDDAMSTVRLIVFTDLDTASPRAEINRLYTAAEFTVVDSRLRFVLEVSREKRDKLIVAVIDEPTAKTAELAAITKPADLDAVRLPITSFATPDHRSLLPGASIPMTGALRTDRLFRTEAEAGRAGNVLRMEVERAVARVDVYLKKGADVDPGLRMASGTVVLLDKTFTESNLFDLSPLPTVASGFVSRSWEYTGPVAAIDESRPVCSFFTPERTHTADRLRVVVGLDTEQGATRRGEISLTTAKDKQGVVHPVDEIRRNHIYAITATIGTNGITADVVDWEDIPITTEL